MTACDCLLKDHPGFEGHTQEDHDKERCTGSWSYDPPCGGCINCITAQAYYYAREDSA